MRIRIVWVLFASLCIHLLLGLGLLRVPSEWSQPALTNVAEIELIEKPFPKKDDDDRLVVRQTKVPDKLVEQDSKEKARFLSEEEQRVLQETRARRSGLTRNGNALPQDSWMRKMPTPQTRVPAQATQGRKFEDHDGPTPIQIPKAKEMTEVPMFDDAPSAVGERLPDDVSLGDFTALNTDRFKYYSFYARVEELVRFRWENNLQRAINSFDRGYLTKIIGRRNWVTRVEFWIAPDGRYLSAHIFKEAGVRSFDLAAINAFREAGFFPNPPAEMVDKNDGTIKLQYTFNVHWSPSFLSDSD